MIIHFSLIFLQFIKKKDYSLIFRPSLFTIHYFLAHYSLFILTKGHYSLIIIPHLDPHICVKESRPYVPQREKTCLRCLQILKAQTSLQKTRAV